MRRCHLEMHLWEMRRGKYYVLQRPCWPDCNWTGDCDKEVQCLPKCWRKRHNKWSSCGAEGRVKTDCKDGGDTGWMLGQDDLLAVFLEWTCTVMKGGWITGVHFFCSSQRKGWIWDVVGGMFWYLAWCQQERGSQIQWRLYKICSNL